MSLYDTITALQGDEPWGAVLDAGTGPGSMRWLLSSETERWTAVTAAPAMAEQVDVMAQGHRREQDRIVVGNWSDDALLAGETYDTVLADYLVGAVDGFTPYWQDLLFQRLRPLVGKRLYVIGLEPYVPYIPEDEAGQMVCNIGRLRDACLLLSGDRPYREYPLDWVIRQLERVELHVVDIHRIGIRYGERFINSQLDMSAQALEYLADRTLAVALHQKIAALRSQALSLCERLGGLRHGHDYIVVADVLGG